MRIPPGARVYLTTVISLAGVALATWFGMQAGAAAVDRQWWTLGAVAASVTAAGVPAYEQIRKERMRAGAGLPVPVRARDADDAGSRSVQWPRGRSAGTERRGNGRR